ncbi:MAG: hypothetical protein M3Y23_03305, partial [Actinomycetota bacterium]|nr:hypothetical protein [Actinomycetota bacterium]
DGPDPECVLGNADQALEDRSAIPPKSSMDHSRKRIINGIETPNPLPLSLPEVERMPSKACDEDPLAGFWNETSKAGA